MKNQMKIENRLQSPQQHLGQVKSMVDPKCFCQLAEQGAKLTFLGRAFQSHDAKEKRVSPLWPPTLGGATQRRSSSEDLR